jgi:hypothetical protein
MRTKYILTSGIEYEVPEKYVRLQEFRYELGGGNDFHIFRAKSNFHVYLYEVDDNRFQLITLKKDGIKEGDWEISIALAQSERFHMSVHSEDTVRFIKESFYAEV